MMGVSNLKIDNLKVHWKYHGEEYRTNGQGEGVWLKIDNESKFHQIRGTCDFRLRGTKGAIRAKLNRMYAVRD